MLLLRGSYLFSLFVIKLVRSYANGNWDYSKVKTHDMHGTSSTSEFTNEVLRKMDELA